MKFIKEMKKNRNNKGFSLVELIIVIAIMAVLVGTLTPQYLRYVEKSRQAADATTLDEFVSVMEVIAASPNNGLSSDTTYTIVFDTDGKITTNSLTALSLYGELVDTTKTYTLKSAAYKACAPTITLAYSDTIWTVDIAATTGTLPATAE